MHKKKAYFFYKKKTPNFLNFFTILILVRKKV
nr:MAG TPA: hypothetical protein [Caudoviricetes sp.]